MKCETGLYGRSPDRSARVCNLCENGDYIQDEKHVICSCIGTEHLRHQFIHLTFDNISEGDIKGFVFQHNSEVYKFISAAGLELNLACRLKLIFFSSFPP